MLTTDAYESFMPFLAPLERVRQKKEKLSWMLR